MPIHYPVRLVDLHQLRGPSQLIQILHQEPEWALSCWCDHRATLVVLRNDFHENIPGPLVLKGNYRATCLSYGPEFVVGFDPYGVTRDGRPDLGDLTLVNDQLHLLVHELPSAEFSGGKCLLNLSTGELVGEAKSPVRIQRWSLSVDAWRNGQLVPAFTR